MARNIIESRRNVTGVVLFVRHDGSTIGRIADDQLWDLLSRNLLARHDDGMRSVIRHIGNALHPGVRHWKDDGSEDNARIVEYGEPWKTRKDDKDVWTLDVREGVTLTVGRNLDPHFRDRGLAVNITFTDTQAATNFDRTVRDFSGRMHGLGAYVEIASVTYESAFFVRSTVSGHYTFTQGTPERLGTRIKDVNGWYRIAPLEGETLVVYDNSLGIGNGPEYIVHPERAFASVGRLSFRLVQGTTARFGGMENHRIYVYEDSLLPIAPQERNGYNPDDFDDTRSSFGYEDEY